MAKRGSKPGVSRGNYNMRQSTFRVTCKSDEDARDLRIHFLTKQTTVSVVTQELCLLLKTRLSILRTRKVADTYLGYTTRVSRITKIEEDLWNIK